jgi:hypothetical protein
MKQRRQIIICFLTVVILTSMFFLVLPRQALAQTIYPGCKIEESKDSKALPIIINFSLPGITTEKKIKNKEGDVIRTEYQVKNLPCFIIGLYTYFAGVAGILATVMVMYGGIKYVVSFGSPQKISDAKDTIFAALSGLVLMLGAYVLLNFINPNLTELKMPDVTGIEKVPDYEVIGLCGPSDTNVYGNPIPCGKKKLLYPDDPNSAKRLLSCMGFYCDRGLFGEFSFCSLNDKETHEVYGPSTEENYSVVYTSGKCLKSEILDAVLISDPGSKHYKISASPSDIGVFDLFGTCGDLWALHTSNLVDWIVSTDCSSNEQCVSYDIPIIPLKSTGAIGTKYFAGIKEGVFECKKVKN